MCPSEASAPQDGETLDLLLRGRLKIIQPKTGYRFSVDSVLLVGLTRIRPHDRVVDLGTGCGVIPLLVAVQQPVAHIAGVEIQESLASMAKRNVRVNRLSHMITIVQGDLRQAHKDMVGRAVTLVVSNPPYGELNSGRLNPDMGKAVARHELMANAADVVKAAARLLSSRGRLALIYPARRLPHLFRVLGQGGFAPKHLTLIHPNHNSPAKLVHLESIKGGGEELRIHKPFIIYQNDGSYTPEMSAIYGNAPVVF